MKGCYCCGITEEKTSTYDLKSGGNVEICLVCENTYEIYLDKIKRDCLIDGVAYDLTKQDEAVIKRERELRKQQKHEEEEYNRLMDSEQSIFYFTNKQSKRVEPNHQVIRYVSGFLGLDDEEADIVGMRFNYPVGKHWHLNKWDGLSNVHIRLDEYSIEHQKVKKPEETHWRNRVRKWYSGRFECDEDFYNVTFGFKQYDDELCGDIYVNYAFICSKSYKVAKLIRELLEADG